MSQTPFTPGAFNFKELLEKKMFGDIKQYTPEQTIQLYQQYGQDSFLKPFGPEAQAAAFERTIPLIEGLQERQAKLAQELGKESAKEAFKYEMLGRLPQQVMQAFAVPAQISSNIQLAGQNAANQIIAEGLRASNINMSNMGYERPTFKYFS